MNFCPALLYSSRCMMSGVGAQCHVTCLPLPPSSFVDPLPSALLQYQAAPQPTPESTPTKLDAPPGLTHPNIQPEKKAPLLPAPLGLPQSHPSPPHTSTEVSMATAPPSQPSPRSALEPAHLPLPPIPHSIEMPASTATPITGQATQYSVRAARLLVLASPLLHGR